ncbi:MAG: hypothetical protein ACO4B4_02730 [Planctomycetota bacterium]
MHQPSEVEETGSDDGRKYRLDDPAHVRRLLRGFTISCGLVALGGLFVKSGHFPIEKTPAFYPVYGFLGCTVIVLAAQAARPILMREENYYDR